MTGEKKMGRDVRLFLLVSWPYFLNDLYLIPLTRTQNISLLWALDIIFYLMIPVATLFVLHRKKLFSLTEIGFHVHPTAAGLAIAVIAALLTHILITLRLEPWLYAHGCCRLCGGYPAPDSGLLKWVTIAYASLTAGFLEETIFRGMLITMLQKYIKRPWATAVVSCAVFAAIHWCQGEGKLIASFIMGILPTIFYLRKRRLAEPILWHMLVDFLAFL